MSTMLSRKEPKKNSKTNYIGVELEFYCTMEEDEVIKIANKLGMGSWCNIGNDSSIEPDEPEDYDEYYEEFELRLLIEESKLTSKLKVIQKFLDRVGAKYNESCGLHVHLDMRNRDKIESYRHLKNYESYMKQMVMSHRRNNDYCVFGGDNIFEKYNAINFNGTRPTIEIRCKEMTTDTIVIKNWIKFLINIVSRNIADWTYINSERSRCS